MLAAYSTRRSSVVLNPRGRVLGGLGGGYEGEGTGVDSGVGGDSGEGYTGFALERAEAEMAAIAAAQDAQAAADAAREASFSASSEEAAAAYAEAKAAADEAALAEQEAAMYANIASISNVASKAALAASSVTAKEVSKVIAGVFSMLGPVGKAVALVESFTGFVGKAIAGTATKSDYANAQKSIDNARNGAGSDQQLQQQIDKVQQSLNAVKTAGIEAAIRQLYLSYAKRQPDPGGLAYWSDRLALPLIAAIAGYFILGS